jgi:hypothetical protein
MSGCTFVNLWIKLYLVELELCIIALVGVLKVSLYYSIVFKSLTKLEKQFQQLCENLNLHRLILITSVASSQ